MKAHPQEEPLLNTLARRVGGAAGFIANAAHGLAPATTRATGAKASEKAAATSKERSISKTKHQSRNRRANSSSPRPTAGRRTKSNLSPRAGN